MMNLIAKTLFLLILTASAVAQNSGEIVVVTGIDPAGPTLDHRVHAMIRDTQNDSHLIECNPKYPDCRKLVLGGRYFMAVLPDDAPGSYRNEINLRITGHHFSAVYFYDFKIKP